MWIRAGIGALLLVLGSFGGGVAEANTLLDLYHQAATNDPTLLGAKFAHDASLEARPQARAALLPQLGAQANYSNYRLHVLSTNQSYLNTVNNLSNNGSNSNSAVPSAEPASTTTYYPAHTYTASISQTLFDWSAFETLSKSRIVELQGAATYTAAEQSLIYRVADAYFGVLLAQDTLKADSDAQAAYREQLEQAQNKYSLGYVSVVDVHNAKASFDVSSASVIADQRALNSARRALMQITGAEPAAIVPLREDISLSAPVPASSDVWTEQALRENPSLKSAFYAAESARKDELIAQSKYLPTLTAGGGISRQDSADSTFGTDAVTDYVGLNMNWTFSTGGLIQSQVRQAAAVYQQQQQAYEAQRRSVDRGAHEAFEGVVSGIESVRLGKQALESDTVSLEANKAGLQVGTRTLVDVLTAQQQLAIALRSYASARYDYLRSMLQLRQAVGALNEADLAQVDSMLRPSAADAD